jgi:hypothetical protein
MIMNIIIIVLWYVTPCCLVQKDQNSQTNYCLHLQGMKGNIEAANSSEMLVLKYQTTWNHVLQNCNLEQHTLKEQKHTQILSTLTFI